MPKKNKKNKVQFLLSSDSLSGYGLDLVFQLAKEIGFDGIDLAMWKNFDARQQDYVMQLMKKYAIDVPVIQTSRRVNLKEMNEAVDLAKLAQSSVISINAPEYFSGFQSGKFLKNHLPAYKHHNKDIKFSIINPQKQNYLGVIPKYYFQDMVQIIKKYKTYLALDIANMDEDIFENQFLRKLSNFMPYISVIYLSDTDGHGNTHLALGEGSLKLPLFLKKLKGLEYKGFFSLKIVISKKDLADMEKIKMILKKCILYYKENYESVKIE